MRRTMSRPIDLTKGVAWIKEESNAILILVIYLCGVTAGGTLAVVFGPVRSAAGRAMSLLTGSVSPISLFLLAAVVSVAFCTFLYGAGLCLIGYPGIYAVPLIVGTAGGIAFLAWMHSGGSLWAVQCGLSLPCFGAAVCCLLMLCGYAADMNGTLLSGRGREAEQEKKYAARFLILSGLMLIFDALQTLLLLLLRRMT